MTPSEIRQLDFFWSARRRRYWNQCRLRYFMHYYAAPLGSADDPDPICRAAFSLNRRCSARAFCRIVLCDSMAEMFSRCDDSSLIDNAVRRCRRECRQMIVSPGSSRLEVSEIADGVSPFGELTDRMTADIRDAASRIEKSFWEKICLIPGSHRRSVERPQPVKLMELDCFFVPVLALSTQGEIWILESSTVKDSGDLISCLHRMWVANVLGRDPTRVRSLHLDEHFELHQLDELLSVSACLEEIRSDINAMLEAEVEGLMTLRDFAPSPGEACADCQFRNYCISAGTFDTLS